MVKCVARHSSVLLRPLQDEDVANVMVKWPVTVHQSAHIPCYLVPAQTSVCLYCYMVNPSGAARLLAVSIPIELHLPGGLWYLTTRGLA